MVGKPALGRAEDRGTCVQYAARQGIKPKSRNTNGAKENKNRSSRASCTKASRRISQRHNPRYAAERQTRGERTREILRRIEVIAGESLVLLSPRRGGEWQSGGRTRNSRTFIPCRSGDGRRGLSTRVSVRRRRITQWTPKPLSAVSLSRKFLYSGLASPWPPWHKKMDPSPERRSRNRLGAPAPTNSRQAVRTKPRSPEIGGVNIGKSFRVQVRFQKKAPSMKRPLF